jgi:hypothetical protein
LALPLPDGPLALNDLSLAGATAAPSVRPATEPPPPLRNAWSLNRRLAGLAQKLSAVHANESLVVQRLHGLDLRGSPGGQERGDHSYSNQNGARCPGNQWIARTHLKKQVGDDVADKPCEPNP